MKWVHHGNIITWKKLQAVCYAVEKRDIGGECLTSQSHIYGLFGKRMLVAPISFNGSGIAEGGDYLHNSPSEAQKFNVVQLLISGTSAPAFGNTMLAVRGG